MVTRYGIAVAMTAAMIATSTSLASPADAASPSEAARASEPEDASKLVIVVNQKVDVKTLTREELRNVYLGITAVWQNGTAVRPFSRPAEQHAGFLFHRNVLRMAPQRYRAYWQDKQTSGGAMAPETIQQPNELIARVQASPGAIAYFLESELPAGMFQLKIIPLANGAESGVAGSTSPAPMYQDVEYVRRRRIEGHDPGYPPTARSREIEGVVVAKVTIGPDGRVTEVALLQTHRAFEGAVRSAIEGWRFEPYLVNGRAVSVYTVFQFVFKLT